MSSSSNSLTGHRMSPSLNMYRSDFAGRGDNSALQESVSSIIPRAEQAMRSIPGDWISNPCLAQPHGLSFLHRRLYRKCLLIYRVPECEAGLDWVVSSPTIVIVNSGGEISSHGMHSERHNGTSPRTAATLLLYSTILVGWVGCFIREPDRDVSTTAARTREENC